MSSLKAKSFHQQLPSCEKRDSYFKLELLSMTVRQNMLYFTLGGLAMPYSTVNTVCCIQNFSLNIKIIDVQHENPNKMALKSTILIISEFFMLSLNAHRGAHNLVE